MASKKAKELSRAVPEPAKAPAPGLWDARILPFLEQRALLIAVCCMAVGCLRIAATWSELGLTFDEPQHFACGLGIPGEARLPLRNRSILPWRAP